MIGHVERSQGVDKFSGDIDGIYVGIVTHNLWGEWDGREEACTHFLCLKAELRLA